MFEIGRINCYGHCLAPASWKFNMIHGINRLYYIHSGHGGYITDGKFHAFSPGKLYFFSYTAEYNLVSDENNRILHTYSDFELIPPIISREILNFTPDDLLSRAALETFVCGGKKAAARELLITPGEQSEAMRMCFSAILYLVRRISTSDKNSQTLTDPIVIKALETMLENPDKPLCISTLAAQSFLTTDSFIRRFKRCIGVTPYSYFKSLRLRTARYMLEDGKSVSLVAQSVGYADAAALLHALKK